MGDEELRVNICSDSESDPMLSPVVSSGEEENNQPQPGNLSTAASISQNTASTNNDHALDSLCEQGASGFCKRLDQRFSKHLQLMQKGVVSVYSGGSVGQNMEFDDACLALHVLENMLVQELKELKVYDVIQDPGVLLVLLRRFSGVLKENAEMCEQNYLPNKASKRKRYSKKLLANDLIFRELLNIVDPEY